MSWRKYIFLIIFGITLILPGLNDFFHIWSFERGDENRTEEKRPEPKLNRLDVYPDQYESYYNDHFAFRSPLLNLYSTLKFELFHISPHPDKSIVGKDNWYFMSQKEKKIFEGKLNFSQKDLVKFKKIWNYRRDEFKKADIKFYWLIAPMKHYVYEELLPIQVVKSKDERRVDQLIEAVDDREENFIIDPLPEFKARVSMDKLYYRQDNHWNETAGLIATQRLISRIKEDYPSLIIPTEADFNWIDSTKNGGIHPMLMDIEGEPEKDRWAKQKNYAIQEVEKCGFEVEKNFPYPDDFERRYMRVDNNDLPRVLIIRDSFAEQMTPFLVASFGETVMIFDSWEYKLNKEILDEAKPDFVIYIGLETHLENIFVDLDNMN